MSSSGPVIPVYLDLVACHGCGACAEVAPELFGMDQAVDQPFLKAGEAPEELVRQAIVYCPNDCITTDDE